ncbi:MAG: hypothetical protein RL434_3166 [Pseudomonadota bacterium]|jgi:alkylation response protein AidB-like acyl-CoA dehydrogenase
MNKPESIAHSDDIAMLAASARTFCDKDAPLSRLRALRGRNGGFDHALWQQMAELGWTAIQVPERAGGLELGVAALCAVVEELGRAAAPEPLIPVAGMSARMLAMLPSSDKVNGLLDGIAAGTCFALPAWQEQAFDPSVDDTGTLAERSAEGWRLSGRKQCIAFADVAQGFLVNARLEGKPAVFWVEPAGPGVSLTLHALADGTSQGTLELAGAVVPAEALLAHGDGVAEALSQAQEEGTLLASAYLLGLAWACFEITLKYLNTRQQFGKVIGSFQALQHRMTNLYLQRQLIAACLGEAIAAVVSNADPRERTLLIHRAKYRATEAAFAITRDSIQLHGGIGFTDECDVGTFVNRALVYGTALGNGTWHSRRIAALAADEAEETVTRKVADPADGDWNSLPDEDFRHAVRGWFETNYPADLRYPPRRMRWSEVKEWYLALSARGWIAPAWPREHGGMGLDPTKLLIFIEEQERHGVTRTPDMGLIMVGPLLIKHGTPEQRAQYLPGILAGENIWCQGYSEPNAGSDLASLRTEAVLDGDHFVINGQKTWTTLAQDATHMFLLARTDKNAKKQAGISFILVDMKTPGITVRPIRNIAGHEEFCEVFMDNVRVPADSLVGGLNQGWSIAKALLGFERIFLGSPKQSQYALQRLTEVARHQGLFEDGAFRDRYTRLKADVLDLETYYQHFAALVKRGETLGPDVSMLKVFGTETYAKLTELLIEIRGTAGARIGKQSLGEHKVDVMSLFYTSRPATIYGGTNEIQRNIVSKAVLALPD